MATQPESARIMSLDVTRGVAVMGIFSVNVVAMAMIKTAYFYPPASGFDSLADKLMWLANFIFVDGKLRALFSIIFGASVMLVIDRACAAGRAPWKVHYPRMLVLLGFGLAHFFLLWWGDILTHYAAVGMLLFLFRRLSARKLFAIAAALLLFNATMSAIFTTKGLFDYRGYVAQQAPPETAERFRQQSARLHPDAATLAEDKAAHSTIVAHARRQWVEDGPAAPLDLGPLWFETLGLMLLGMAGFKSGFLTGGWSRGAYRRTALAALVPGIAIYAGLAWWSWSHAFAGPYANAAYGGYSPILRPIMAMGYAALAILLARPGGALTGRFAAVGRMAFSNYLGCTIVGTLLFFGFGGGLYGEVSRAEAWLLVSPVWLAMLLWSKAWLDRFQYGPLEWAWRSLARGRAQPMRR